MNVEWVEGEIAGGKGAFGILDTGFTVAIFRQRDGSIWFSAALPQSSLTFDRHRMPILWVDDSIVCDAGETVELSFKAERAFNGDDKTFMPYHMVGDNVVGFRLWHGDPSGGLGNMTPFLTGKNLSVRYFVVPHDSIDITVSLSGLPSLMWNTLRLKAA